MASWTTGFGIASALGGGLAAFLWYRASVHKIRTINVNPVVVPVELVADLREQGRLNANAALAAALAAGAQVLSITLGLSGL